MGSGSIWFRVPPSGGSHTIPFYPFCHPRIKRHPNTLIMALNMANRGSLINHAVRRCLVFIFLCALSFAPFARAELQFDVFPGYDGVVPEASWFPVACEVHNDGPSFNAFFEISSGKFNSAEVRRVPIELPTNTRKRVVIPVFSTSRHGSWNFRLIDDRGNVRSEQLNVRPRKQPAWETPVIGALARSIGGVPVLPQIKSNQQELQPTAARLDEDYFPDNPIALEGLDIIYLNSQSALELKVGQRDALLAWLNGGGHLIVSVEQIGDISASGWLEGILPCELTDTKMLSPNGAFQNWFQLPSKMSGVSSRRANRKNQPAPGVNPFSQLSADTEFDQKEMLIFTGQLRDGTVLMLAQEIPLMIEAPRGRGRITLLTFNVEREPFVSWKNRSWFWAKLAEVQPGLYETSDYNSYGGSSIDGVFGALIDSKQVRKLPLTWLLVLLIVYLLVIGPLDQFWLKKINRQMLTWITFPAYVLFFSVLIYFIGFKLRAGDSEFNELHIVDVLPRNESAVLRGRTYASIYSPSNARYPLVGSQPFSALRGEFSYSYSGAEGSGNATIVHHGNTFAAEVSVPVWTSQLCVNDWLQPADLPLKITAVANGENWDVAIENRLDRKLSEARVVIAGRVYLVGDLAANKTRNMRLETKEGVELKTFAERHGANFLQAVQFRRGTFGNSHQTQFDVPLSTMVASFGSQLDQSEHQYFISPDGLDLSSLAEQGNVILLAWDAGNLLTKPLNKFKPRRGRQDTLLRLVVPNKISRVR